MSTSRFAVWLRVTPSPLTIAESSAIFKSLKSQGRVTHFVKYARPSQLNDGSTTYYVALSHEPPSLKTSFEVPVYHNLLSPHDLDPFRIRGLQDRKPFPPPKTFSCRIEHLQTHEGDAGYEVRTANPYHGSFKVQKHDWLQSIYAETGAPPGVKEGLGLPEENASEQIAPVSVIEVKQEPTNKKARRNKSERRREARCCGCVQRSGSISPSDVTTASCICSICTAPYIRRPRFKPTSPMT